MSIVDKAIASSVKIVPRPIVKKISSRYIAGEKLGEAVEVIRNLNQQGCVATIDVLGESTEDKQDAAAKLKEYKEVVDVLDEHDLDSGISVKLTGLGLVFDEDVCRENLEEIIMYAGERNRFVRMDMEDSPYTAKTVQMAIDMHEKYDNVGTVIQAYMRRSLKDISRLAESGVTARLCKGIYDEPREYAYKDFETVRQNYILLLEEMFKAGVYVGVATHDEFLIWHALRLIHQLDVSKDRYEFQMLLGVDEELRSILVNAGHKLRVYVPFGDDWYKYSTRRLQENPKIARYVAEDVVESMLSYVKS
ncbi:MAG: proline dehydrogenase family protein [Rubrobacteraceae bacterium]